MMDTAFDILVVSAFLDWLVLAVYGLNTLALFVSWRKVRYRVAVLAVILLPLLGVVARRMAVPL
jgi:hypothetical protein